MYYLPLPARTARSGSSPGLTERTREQPGRDVDDLLAAPFRDWEATLRFLVRLVETDPLLVVIDEAPRLLSSKVFSADDVIG